MSSIINKIISIPSNGYINSTSSFDLRVSGTNRLFIENSGNVGVGTTDPNNLLDIFSSTNPTLSITNGTINSIFKTDTTNTLSSIGTSSNHSLSFLTNNAEQMRILSNGNVGIGITNPTEKLQVNGDIDITGDFKQNGVPISGGSSQWTTVNTNEIYYDAGNVGIGTDNPTSLLDIYSSGTSAVNLTNYTAPSLDNNTSVYTLFGKNGGPRNGLYTHFRHISDESFDNYVHYDFNTAENILTLRANGNVGIGMTNSGERLEVAGCVSVLSNSSIPNSVRQSGNSAPYDIAAGGIYYNTTKNCLSVYNGSLNGAIIFEPDSAGIFEAMRITGYGVGIGTDNPQAKLQVQGTAYFKSDYGLDSTAAIISGEENKDSILFFGTPYQGDILNAYKTAIIAEGNTSYSRSTLHFCLNNEANNTASATLGNSRMCILSNGNVGVGMIPLDNEGRINIKLLGNGDITRGFRLIRGDAVSFWNMNINAGNDLVFAYGADHTNGNEGNTQGFIENDNSGNRMNFTGQHRCFIKDTEYIQIVNLKGLIVSSNNNNYINMSNGTVIGIEAITTNEALPIVSLTNLNNDKSVFGVISDAEDPNNRIDKYGAFCTPYPKEQGDTRAYINSVGEGAIWVSNISGSLEAGDYITSSTISGYGKKQNDDILHNYTVAKITMNCDFTNPQVPKYVIKKDSEGNNILDNLGNLIWEEDLDNEGNIIYQNSYELRYLEANGTIITKEEYLLDNTNRYIAAFVGCTYHCG